MRHSSPGLTLAGIAALLLVACSGGGGGSGSSSSGGTANTPPVANAGANQTVTSGNTVTLNGTASSDSDGTVVSYAWTQTAGSAVTLTNGNTSQATFSAPAVAGATALTFSLVVTDNRGSASPANTVTVTVNPAGGSGTIIGQITFARVPFKPRTAGNPNAGLDYANPAQQPSRGVLVRALASGTTNPLTSTTTDALGNYSLSVAANTMVTIEVVARMVRDTTQALPRWNMRVQNGVTTTVGNITTVIDVPYTYTDGVSFNSNAGIAHNIAIPAGSNAAGTAPSARPSAAFAILDTLYQGIQTITGVAPTTDFPTLIVDWGSQTEGTFFTTGPQEIALLADLNTDTDEFDQHVIAHEFGHYIEFNFSRANNIGGSHGVGDKLDPRVAFGEGFGYAFAAIVLNDPLARDSFVDDSPFTICGVAHCSGGFNIESNPPSTAVARTNYGCWCSESSVWSILWDLFDTAADTNDTVAMGFEPMWNVLTGAQRTTPAFTTIFSYVTALKAQNADRAAAIDTLVAAQNVTSVGMDAYGTTEMHAPVEVPSVAALPVYGVATVGGPAVVLSTVDDAESPSDVDDGFNKIGDRRFVRFTLAATRDITIKARSSNANVNSDTDFILYLNGVRFRSATLPPPTGQEEELFVDDAPAGDYLIDVYDCANGCDGPEGVSGDYTLTVTVN
jgi:hypothetical protein